MLLPDPLGIQESFHEIAARGKRVNHHSIYKKRLLKEETVSKEREKRASEKEIAECNIVGCYLKTNGWKADR